MLFLERKQLSRKINSTYISILMLNPVYLSIQEMNNLIPFWDAKKNNYMYVRSTITIEYVGSV